MADISIQDSLKYAAEKFVIEFPEFEDLDIDDLYKEMKKKGYFGDERKYDKVSKKILKTAKKAIKHGAKATPLGLIADIGSRVAMKSKAVEDLISPEPKTYKRGGAVKRYKGGLMVKPKAAKRGY